MIKFKPTVREAKVANLAGTQHAHRCTGPCQGRYEDNCTDPHGDTVCATCRHGNTWSLWRTNTLPASCCYRHSMLATPADLASFRLGGRSTWWICTHCKRTHPFNPEGDLP